MRSKNKTKVDNWNEMFKRVACGSHVRRGGSHYVCSEHTEEQIKIIKDSLIRTCSASMFFKEKVEDLCFSLNQIQVVENVAEKQHLAALEKLKLEKGSTQFHESVKTQTSSSSDDSRLEPSLNVFEEKESPQRHQQHLEYLGRTTATQLPTYPERQTPPRELVSRIGSAIEKDSFVPTYIKSPKKSDTSDGTSDSSKSYSTFSKSSHNSVSCNISKNINLSTHSSTQMASASYSAADTSEEFSIVKEKIVQETVGKAVAKTKPVKVYKVGSRRSLRIKEILAARNKKSQ